MKFKYRPLEVEAVQFDGNNFAELQEFCGKYVTRDGQHVSMYIFNPVHTRMDHEDPEVIAEVWDKFHDTWYGVKQGDWIIKGTKGEFFPRCQEVFAATFEPLGE